jgi:hypothetical protein
LGLSAPGFSTAKKNPPGMSRAAIGTPERASHSVAPDRSVAST